MRFSESKMTNISLKAFKNLNFWSGFASIGNAVHPLLWSDWIAINNNRARHGRLLSPLANEMGARRFVQGAPDHSGHLSFDRNSLRAEDARQGRSQMRINRGRIENGYAVVFQCRAANFARSQRPSLQSSS